MTNTKYVKSALWKDDSQRIRAQKKVQAAAKAFLKQYPEGFEDPALSALAKRHKMSAIVAYAKAHLSQMEQGRLPERALEIKATAIQLINKSSMVSLFEKPKFRDALNSFSHEETQRFALGLWELLHGQRAMGFTMLQELLTPYGIAKWPVLTAFLCYCEPEENLLVKPTTVKGVIAYFDFEDLKYPTKPNYEFYQTYNGRMCWLAKQVDASLSPTMAHFSGFLMMVLEGLSATNNSVVEFGE